MSTLLSILEEGFIYAIMALGVYITYKILDFPDLSVDGTFPLGGAVGVLFIRSGMNPFLTLLLSFLAGALTGIVTGIIHVKFKVRDLLCGIIVMTALYSINLRIAQSANVPIFGNTTVFDHPAVNGMLPSAIMPFVIVFVLFAITLLVKLLLDLYMKTRSGYLLRAVGDNESIVTSLAKDKGMVKIIGLSIANGLAALAGNLYCQQKGFFDINMGTGAIVIGLASVIIGTKLFKRFGFIKTTTAVILGSILYKACVSFAIFQTSEASDIKLITAVLFLIVLVISSSREKKVKKHA